MRLVIRRHVSRLLRRRLVRRGIPRLDRRARAAPCVGPFAFRGRVPLRWRRQPPSRPADRACRWRPPANLRWGPAPILARGYLGASALVRAGDSSTATSRASGTPRQPVADTRRPGLATPAVAGATIYRAVATAAIASRVPSTSLPRIPRAPGLGASVPAIAPPMRAGVAGTVARTLIAPMTVTLRDPARLGASAAARVAAPRRGSGATPTVPVAARAHLAARVVVVGARGHASALSPWATAPQQRRLRRSSIAVAPPEPGAPRSRPAEPAPLVWRKASAAPDEAASRAVAAPRGAPPSAAGHVDGAPPVTRASALEPPPRLAPPPSPPPFALTGPVVDRLAEDVIARIERRARIDRERRGL